MKIPAGTPLWLVCVLLCLCIVGIGIALYGMLRKTRECSRICKKCKHGDVNFWGYDECWKYCIALDTDTTKFTAMREKDAIRFNSDGDCVNYE